jgi:pimeloyl-ACP methyl ester carboxylesterase
MKYICFNIITIFLLVLLFTGCKKEFTGLSTKADEIFWVTNNGADMPVRVMGNTSSKVIILIVHGGPGDGSYDYTDFKTARLRENYGVAFWDQRNAGSASGNNNMDKLSLPQMINDLEVVVKVLKFRYEEADIFLYAHSFGGLLAAGYLVKDSNQNQLNGWIEIDGAHNYPLCNTSSRKMLMDTAASEINKGNYTSQWQNILNYCSSHDPLSSYEISSQTETYAHSAESYMGIKPNNSILSLAEDPSDQLVNYYTLYHTTYGKDFLESLETADYSSELYKIKVPSLLLWGQYDFTVPPVVGIDGITNLGSSYKKLVLFPHSGHHPMETDTDLVEDEIISFVDTFK